MADLRELTERLRRLGTRRPSPEARTEVLAGLSSKWEGVQVVATGVLGRWGDRESVERLREFLSECFGREAGWGIREVIVRALRPAVTEADVGWVLDLYFRLEGWLPKHELQWLVIALPPRAARARLVAALRDPRWDNRHAAVKATRIAGSCSLRCVPTPTRMCAAACSCWPKGRPNQLLHLTRPAHRFSGLRCSLERAGQVSRVVRRRRAHEWTSRPMRVAGGWQCYSLCPTSA